MNPDPSTLKFTFDPLKEQDLEMLREWLQRPHVARWWGPAESVEELRQDYIVGVDDPNATRAYIAKVGGEPIGFIQCYVVMGSGHASEASPRSGGGAVAKRAAGARPPTNEASPRSGGGAVAKRAAGARPPTNQIGWWEGETDPGARGTDQFLAEEHRLGQGLGRAMVRAFVEQVFEDARVTVVQTDPDPTNERAIRCYTRAGFAPVGVVTTPDGSALLMRCHRPTRTNA